MGRNGTIKACQRSVSTVMQYDLSDNVLDFSSGMCSGNKNTVFSIERKVA